jgi:hypothetical protein
MRVGRLRRLYYSVVACGAVRPLTPRAQFCYFILVVLLLTSLCIGRIVCYDRVAGPPPATLAT